MSTFIQFMCFCINRLRICKSAILSVSVSVCVCVGDISQLWQCDIIHRKRNAECFVVVEAHIPWPKTNSATQCTRTACWLLEYACRYNRHPIRFGEQTFCSHSRHERRWHQCFILIFKHAALKHQYFLTGFLILYHRLSRKIIERISRTEIAHVYA